MNPKERKQGVSNEIPLLVQQAIRPDKTGRKALQQLRDKITTTPSLEPLFFAHEAFQTALLSAREPGKMRRIQDTWSTILVAVQESITQPLPGKQVGFTPEIQQSIARIAGNDERIEQNRNLWRFLPTGIRFMRNLVASAVDDIKQGKQGIIMMVRNPSITPREIQEIKPEVDRWNSWLTSVKRLFSSRYTQTPAERDSLIDLLKEEPENSLLFGRFFTKRHAGLSLEDIEAMSYQPSVDALNSITDYLIASLLEDPSVINHDSISDVLLTGTKFYDTETATAFTYRNKQLLANINLWQEHLLYSMLFAQEEIDEKRLAKLLDILPQELAMRVAGSLLRLSTIPTEYDPEDQGDILKQISHHPLLVQAGGRYATKHQRDTSAPIFIDAAGREYLREVLLPLFRDRIKRFGAEEKFARGIALVEEKLVEQSFAEIHVDTLKRIFGRNCGEAFLEKLSMHHANILGVTETVWQSILEGEMHFLPMREGVNIIEFTEGSTPEILGFDSVTINTSGSPQEWQTNLTFALRESLIAIFGRLDQNGKLHLDTPIDRDLPGLYAILNLIAVLTFHDLVVQQQAEERISDTSGITTKPFQKAGGLELARDIKQRPSEKPQSGILPRRQTDAELIHHVYRNTGFPPRRVELHRVALKYAKQYEAAIQLYNEAVTQGAGTEQIDWITRELEQTRERANRISAGKQASVPARFQLKIIQDPLTGETRHLETWVVEHTSPKPSREELQSPALLFRRHYKRSSALAFLDQLKPWFIGK